MAEEKCWHEIGIKDATAPMSFFDMPSDERQIELAPPRRGDQPNGKRRYGGPDKD
jgi:hypothetical protein